MSPDEAALAAGIDAVETLGPLDPAAMADAAAILDALTKPPGSLGRLEDLVIQLAGITATARPTLRDRAIVVAAADHGVARQGVSAYPAEVTTQMVGNFLAGGAAINTLGAIVGASLTVIDVGVAGSIPDAAPEGGHGARLIRARVRQGTADMTIGAGHVPRGGAPRHRRRPGGESLACGRTAWSSSRSARWASATRPPPARSRPR